jgi:hypothetical protein
MSDEEKRFSQKKFMYEKIVLVCFAERLAKFSFSQKSSIKATKYSQYGAKLNFVIIHLFS